MALLVCVCVCVSEDPTDNFLATQNLVSIEIQVSFFQTDGQRERETHTHIINGPVQVCITRLLSSAMTSLKTIYNLSFCLFWLQQTMVTYKWLNTLTSPKGLSVFSVLGPADTFSSACSSQRSSHNQHFVYRHTKKHFIAN